MNNSPAYYQQSVAEVCLNCKHKKCLNVAKGCEAYRIAYSKADKGRPTHGSDKLICVDGVIHTLYTWTQITGVNRNALYVHAYRRGWTMEQEIKYRLEKGAKNDYEA